MIGEGHLVLRRGGLCVYVSLSTYYPFGAFHITFVREVCLLLRRGALLCLFMSGALIGGYTLF
jgi:hypothetical protein